MLAQPERGFARSVTKHNVSLDALCDWIEGTSIFDGSRVSKSDLVDVLSENHIYASQDFAAARMDDAWAELRRRSYCLGSRVPYVVRGGHVEPNMQWQDALAYAFCLALSLQVWYPSWAKKHADYALQGELFELLTYEAFVALGWRVERAGWSPADAKSLSDAVSRIADKFGESVSSGGVLRWTAQHAKDAGLDLVCTQDCLDGWHGKPLFLVQCASGADWLDKLKTPDLRIWSKLIDFTTAPLRALAMPFAPLADEFRRAAATDGLGLLWDRHRLLSSAIDKRAWPSRELAKRIDKWIGDRASDLPKVG